MELKTKKRSENPDMIPQLIIIRKYFELVKIITDVIKIPNELIESMNFQPKIFESQIKGNEIRVGIIKVNHFPMSM